MLFFQFISHRYEHASTVLTSNKGFEEWGTILGDEVMAAALIDRLMHHCHVVNLRGNSYRMREHPDLRLGLQPSSDSAAAQTALRRRKKESPGALRFAAFKGSVCNLRPPRIAIFGRR